ncbi:MAG: YqgE/AlgH family protein [Sulfuritalea sp.]|nr:YqgE/AlgH family protein [Sulfuritalea sp.]
MRRRFISWSALIATLWLCGAPLRAADVEGASSVLLIAAEGIADPRFQQSVVLVTRHGSSNSTLGVIVNRSLGVPLDRLFPKLKQAAEHHLHYGGPVAEGRIVFLVRSAEEPAAAIAMAEQLFLSSDGGSLHKLLAAPTPVTRLRVFSGFASWAPDQLEHEIDRGDWYLLPVDAEALFGDALDDMWPKLWRRATQVMVQSPPAARQAAPQRKVAAAALRQARMHAVRHRDRAYPL